VLAGYPANTRAELVSHQLFDICAQLFSVVASVHEIVLNALMRSRNTIMSKIKILVALIATAVVSFAHADDEAAMTAEVYAIAKGAKNEAVLEHVSDPKHYEAMAKRRSEDDTPKRENLRVREVTVEHTDATHAVARAQYDEKHGGASGEEEIHLELKEGKWQVTAPPAPAKP
jgi:hypothetical protein